MQTTPHLLLWAAVLTVGCDHSPTQPTDQPERPSAAVVTNEHDRTIIGPVTNDCTGEVIFATVNVHTLAATTQDAAGGIHETLHQNLSFAGTSETSGVHYVGHQTFDLAFNAKVGEEQTVQLTFTLIGQGSAPNEVSTFIGHYTLLADGTVTSDFDNFRVRCQ